MGKTYSGPREALRLNGKFVLSHLLEATKAGPDLSSSPFAIGLHQEVSTSMQTTDSATLIAYIVGSMM